MKMVHLVVAGGIPLAAYETIEPAYVHARTITGAVIFELPLLTQTPKSVRDDLAIEDEFENGGDTPLDDPGIPMPKRES